MSVCFTTLNNYDSYFNLTSEESEILIEKDEEKNWICKAIEDIKSPETIRGLRKRISQQVDTLNSFTPDQIIRLVSFLDQSIRREPNSKEAINYLHQEVAALIVKKDISHFENFFQQSRGKNYAIQSIIQLVSEGMLTPLETLDELDRYGIGVRSPEGQTARIEIAKLTAQQDCRLTCYFIKNYGIDASTYVGQQGLIQIAKLAAQKNGGAISRRIRNFGIHEFPGSQQALIEIAKLAAQQNGSDTSEFIKNYGIDDSTPAGQLTLIEIAKLAAQYGRDFSTYIQCYGLDKFPGGPQALIEIAKLAAQQDGGTTSEFIKNYGIDASTPVGQQVLIEIAKLAAQQDGMTTSEFIRNYGIDASTLEGQQALIEIAKLASQRNARATSRYIKNYGLTEFPRGQQALIEIAKLVAKQKDSKISEYIQNYGIDASTPQGQQAMIEIAKLAAKQDGEGTSEFIRNFGIDASTLVGQQALIDIAMLAAKQNVEGFCRYIKKYGIDNYNFSGCQGALVEIAKLAAQQEGWAAYEIINYGISSSTTEGRQALIEIFKLAAEQNIWATLNYLYFNVYGFEKITDEGKQDFKDITNFLFSCIVKQLAPFSYSALKNNIKFLVDKLDGNGKDTYQLDLTLFDSSLAKLKVHDREGSVKDSLQLCATLFDMKLEDLQWVNDKLSKAENEAMQADFLEWWLCVASLCASRSDLKELFKEKPAVFERMSSLSPNLRNTLTKEVITSTYPINSPFLDKLKAEILYSIDQLPGGQKALIEIAKLAAINNGGETSKYLQSYGIDASTPAGQQARIEIAKLAAQQNGAGTSRYIHKYGIDKFPGGQQALIEIAKLAAKQNGGGTSEYIQNYGIDASAQEGQRALIEIAKAAAKQDGRGTTRYIDQYGIDKFPEGQHALIEIAKLAAEQNTCGTLFSIKNYGIDASIPEYQQRLTEILKRAAQQNAALTLTSFDWYDIDRITDEGKQRYKDISNLLFSCLIKHSGSFSYSAFKNYFSSFKDKLNGNGKDTNHLDLSLFDSSLAKLNAHDIEGAINDSLQIGLTLFEMHFEGLRWVKNNLLKFDKEAMQTEFLEWWMCVVSLCASREDLKRLFREKPSVFERISTLSPDLRNTLTKELIASSYDADSRYLDKLKAEILDESSSIKKITVLPRDLRIEVTSLFIRGHQSPYAQSWESMIKATEYRVHARLACLILAHYPQGNYASVLGAIKADRSLREAKYQQPMLEALLAIKHSSLDEAAKVTLLHNVFNIPVNERQKGFRLVTDILNFKGEAYLSEISDFLSLTFALEKLFSDKCKVKCDNFADLYANTVGTWRSKEALLTYAGKQTGNPEVLPYFLEFLDSVLKSQFRNQRYAIDKNPHLAEIHLHYPKIFEQWKLSAALEGSELGIKETDKAIPAEKRVVDALKRSVENDHLGLGQQKNLFPFLEGCKGNWKQLKKTLGLVADKLAQLSNRRLTAEEIELKQRLLLEKYLLELVNNPIDIEKKLNNLNGIKIKGLERVLDPFYRDLEDALKFMHSSTQSKAEAYTLIDTDDPNHFLLMGTEVLNSCQNVKGSASFNVGLLGYAMDGKHRLALVCDPEGKILARSVLRLLVDAEDKPVLFQERMYVADANPAYPQLLRKMALKKAELLGIPLVVSPEDFEKEQAKPYPLSIKAKAKPVPFEYVDALGSLKSGPYTIDIALHLNLK